MRLGGGGAPEGYALAPAPRGERPVAGQRRVAVPVGQQLVDGALGHPGQLGLRLDHRPHALEGALALGPAVPRPRPLPPVFRDRVPVQAVALAMSLKLGLVPAALCMFSSPITFLSIRAPPAGFGSLVGAYFRLRGW